MRVLESGSAVLNALSRADIRVLAETVFFEAGHHPQNQPIEGPLSQTDVEISLYQSDRIEVEIAESREPTVLVVTNSYSPYWIGLIDGVETPVFPADHAFWGVFVPAGAKKVVFEYRPPYRLR